MGHYLPIVIAMMRSVCLLAALVSAISASVVPFRLNFPEGQQPSLRSIANCAGHEDDILTVIGGSSPDEICMPGTMVMDVNTLLKEDLPEDLIFDLKLQKLEPFPMGPLSERHRLLPLRAVPHD